MSLPLFLFLLHYIYINAYCRFSVHCWCCNEVHLNCGRIGQNWGVYVAHDFMPKKSIVPRKCTFPCRAREIVWCILVSSGSLLPPVAVVLVGGFPRLPRSSLICAETKHKVSQSVSHSVQTETIRFSSGRVIPQ